MVSSVCARASTLGPIAEDAAILALRHGVACEVYDAARGVGTRMLHVFEPTFRDILNATRTASLL